METTKKVITAWKTIYSNWRYSLWVVIIALAFYLINVLIQNHSYKTLTSFFTSAGLLPTLKLFLSFSLGLYATMTPSSFSSLIITAVLIGVLLTLLFYKTKALKNHGLKKSKKQGIVASIGIFLGVAAPGCAACGVGLLALFGIGSAVLGSFPLHGLEISLIAIVILVVTILYLSKGLLECTTCQIQLHVDSNANS